MAKQRIIFMINPAGKTYLAELAAEFDTNMATVIRAMLSVAMKYRSEVITKLKEQV